MSSIHQLPNLSGQQFGHYRLIKLIDQGGFADIYLAQHVYLETYVALKILRTHLAQKDRQKFLEEARTIASLDHPHIVHVSDFGMHDGIPYIAMQFADKGSLRDLHPHGTRLSPTVILCYIQQIAGALAYLHERELVHQDIKSENMLLDAKNGVLLSDFGLAVVIREVVSQKTEDFACTLAYTAPERFNSNYLPSPASDQYALAIVVYEWLTGKRPFQGNTLQIVQQHLYSRPTPLRRLVSDIPVRVENVVLKALEKKPEHRFKSVQAFVSALNDAYETSYNKDKQSVMNATELEEMALALVAYLFVAAIPAAVAYLSGVDIQASWLIFAFCILIFPAVEALIQRGRLALLVVFSALAISAFTGVFLHSLFIAGLTQFVLLDACTLCVYVKLAQVPKT